MFGGGPERTNASPLTLTPPLQVAWRYNAAAGFGPYSPAAADSLLFVGNLQGEIHVIDLRSGAAVGIFDFGPAVFGTPVVDRDRLFVTLSNTEESLIAYNTLAGRIEWRIALGEIESSPLRVGDRLIVTTLRGNLIAVDAATGSVLWTFRSARESAPSFIRSSPASDGMRVVFGSDEGWIYAVNLTDGSLMWKAAVHGSVAGSPSILDGRVYTGTLTGNFTALDISDGTILWQRNLGGMIYGSQAVDGRMVYVATTARTVHALDALTGATIWSAPATGVVSAGPFLAGNVLYVGTIDRTLSAFEAASGKALWGIETEARVQSILLAYHNHLVVLMENHEVVAYRAVENER